MNDMSAVIIPKSDQINADDLLAAPMTITIERVDIKPGTEQPVSIAFAGSRKFYRPCKSMARVMVTCWGPDANAYVGRSMTLYCDPNVKWGGMAVGGIRISHLSHIEEARTLLLTETKANRKPFNVKPLKIETSTPKRTFADFLAETATQLNGCETEGDVNALASSAAVVKALALQGSGAAKLNEMIKAALDRVSPPLEVSTEEDPGADFDAASA